MFENPRRGRQAKNFTTSVPKILDLRSSSEQIFSEIVVGCPCLYLSLSNVIIHNFLASKFSFLPQIAGLMDCRSEMAKSQKEDTNSDSNGHLFDVLGNQ